LGHDVEADAATSLMAGPKFKKRETQKKSGQCAPKEKTGILSAIELEQGPRKSRSGKG